MTLKYSPILAILLVAGAQAVAATTARADAAKASTLDQEPPDTVRIRCFMGTTQDQMPTGRSYEDLGRGWFCMPEEKPASTR